MSNPYEPHNIPPQPKPPGSPESISGLDAVIPTNPLAAVSCWSGIIGLLLCPCGIVLGPVAIITGVIALRTSAMQETQYGKATSTIRIWIGIGTGIFGVIMSIIFVVAVLASG